MASTPPNVLRAALASLHAPGISVDQVSADRATNPGLYAFHADGTVWRELGLGDPPDDRPLYVGKAEGTLASRDLNAHFGRRPRGVQSPTGSSTLRRSLAALLADGRGYRGQPRNPAKPGYFDKFGLSEAHDGDLSAWMARHLRLALWPHADISALGDIETDVLGALLSPLNLDKVSTPWGTQVRAARAVLTIQSRKWSETTSSYT